MVREWAERSVNREALPKGGTANCQGKTQMFTNKLKSILPQ